MSIKAPIHGISRTVRKPSRSSTKNGSCSRLLPLISSLFLERKYVPNAKATAVKINVNLAPTRNTDAPPMPGPTMDAP